jgi:hypothetical protein
VKSRILRGRSELRELLEPLLNPKAEGQPAQVSSRGMERFLAGGEE